MSASFKHPEKVFIEEMEFSASRSSGPGGQHVNKVNTKVEIRFNIENTKLLTDEEKILLHQNIGNKINKAGELIIVSEEFRSQTKNRQSAIEKFFKLLTKVLSPLKKRIATKPSVSSKMKRRDDKKMLSAKKQNRKIPEIE